MNQVTAAREGAVIDIGPERLASGDRRVSREALTRIIKGGIFYRRR
jgi:hypothetical protein